MTRNRSLNILEYIRYFVHQKIVDFLMLQKNNTLPSCLVIKYNIYLSNENLIISFKDIFFHLAFYQLSEEVIFDINSVLCC